MAQVKFGVCLNEFSARPQLTPRFSGPYTPLLQPRCMAGWEERRRRDVAPAKYGSGIPSVRSVAFDPWGVPIAYEGEYTALMTEQGPINLSKIPSESFDTTFMPTSAMLQLAPYTDSRMLYLSDRYYNR